MKKIKNSLLFISLFLTNFTSCKQNTKGIIYFDLDGGSFSDPTFNVEYLEGVSNTPVKVDIPDPVKEGYTFVSWREKLEGGNFIEVRKVVNPEDNKAYYYYPYGSSVLYAYFEPRISMSFDLTEGKDNKGELLLPEIGNNFQNNQLNGYTNMSINSLSYLPKAKAEEMSFDYWYLKKPLKKEETASGKRYVIDESKEEGIYRFDEQFNLETMVFPYAESKNITLYAKWASYPIITMHFNLPNIEDYSFKAKNQRIDDKLNEGIKTRLSVDFSLDGYHFYNELRFAGYYLDRNYTKEFYLNSLVNDSSLDLYLKWEKKIKVTLDYNGGKVNDKEQEEFDFYENDILGDEFIKEHTPSKINTSFRYFVYNDKEFLSSSFLPNEDITLVAFYIDDILLSLNYSYPISFTDAKLDNRIYFFKKGDNIKAYLDNFKQDFISSSNNSLIPSYFYTKDINNKEIIFNDNIINEDMTIYLKLLYKKTINIYSYESKDTILDGSEKKTIILPKNTNLNLNDYEDLKSKIEVNGKIYLPSSYYLDSSLTKEITFPFSISLSTNNDELNIYREMKEGIKLTFYDENNNPYIVENNSNIYYVIKDFQIDDSIPEALKNKILKTRDGKRLGNYFPSTSCDIIVS